MWLRGEPEEQVLRFCALGGDDEEYPVVGVCAIDAAFGPTRDDRVSCRSGPEALGVRSQEMVEDGICQLHGLEVLARLPSVVPGGIVRNDRAGFSSRPVGPRADFSVFRERRGFLAGARGMRDL